MAGKYRFVDDVENLEDVRVIHGLLDLDFAEDALRVDDVLDEIEFLDGNLGSG